MWWWNGPSFGFSIKERGYRGHEHVIHAIFFLCAFNESLSYYGKPLDTKLWLMINVAENLSLILTTRGLARKNVTLHGWKRPWGHCYYKHKQFLRQKDKMASEPEAVDWQSIKSLVFGGGVKQTVLDRWLQPFTFSSQVEEKSCLFLKSHPKEPAALVQGAGGPCAVIAPLQAFLLKVSQLFHGRC